MKVYSLEATVANIFGNETRPGVFLWSVQG